MKDNTTSQEKNGQATMKKALSIILKIFQIISLVGSFLWVGFGVVLVALINNLPTKTEAQKAVVNGIRNFGSSTFELAILLTVILVANVAMSTWSKKIIADKFNRKNYILAGILNCLVGDIPAGVLMITLGVKTKEQVFVSNLPTAEAETIPEHPEGYHPEENMVVRLVNGKRPNNVYRVSGIDDVAAKNNWKAWIYLAPVIVLLSVFLLYPLVNTIFISFMKEYDYINGAGSKLTFDNFAIVLGLREYSTQTGSALESNFIKFAVPNTIIITFITVPVSIFLALIIAVALNSIKWFQKFLQTVFFLPYVTNGIAIGMVFAVIFDKSGIINNLFHIKEDWILNADVTHALVVLCIYIVWNSIPFKILILLSGLQGVDKQYYNAAQIDAAPKHKILFKITVPLLSPQILYLMITGFIGAFKEYTSVVAIFNGPTTASASTKKELLTVVYYVYDILEHDSLTKMQLGAAGAVLLFVVILLFTFVQFRVSKTRVHY